MTAATVGTITASAANGKPGRSCRPTMALATQNGVVKTRINSEYAASAPTGGTLGPAAGTGS